MNNTNKELKGLMSTKYILTTEFEEPDWIVDNLLPPGLTILSGRPKIGKSWLAYQLSKAVAEGSKFLGQDTEKGKVLYLALEDIPKRIQNRTSQQSWNENIEVDWFTYGSLLDTLDDLDISLTEFLQNAISWENYSLVIIDPFNRMTQLEGKHKNQNRIEHMLELLVPLQELSQEHGVGLLVVDHHRKGNSRGNRNPITDILGSTAKGATLDTNWGLYDEGNRKGTLSITGRDVEQQELEIVFDNTLGLWLTEAENSLTDLDREFIEIVRKDGPISAYAVAKEADRASGPVYRQKDKLIELGYIYEDINGELTTIPPENQDIEERIETKEDNIPASSNGSSKPNNSRPMTDKILEYIKNNGPVSYHKIRKDLGKEAENPIASLYADGFIAWNENDRVYIV